MSGYNPNRKASKRREYEKSYRPWNLQNLNKSGGKSESPSSSNIGDNSSNTSPTTPTTLSFPQQNFQISSFEKSQHIVGSSSINHTANTWVLNNSPLIDNCGVITSNQQEQSQFSPVQTSALLNSYLSDTDDVAPRTSTITSTFAKEAKTSWPATNPWETSTKDIPDSNQTPYSWNNDTSNSDNSSWATAHSSLPSAEPSTVTEQGILIHKSNINTNDQQQHNFAMLSPTLVAKKHSSPSTPSPSLSQYRKVMDKSSSGERGNWNKGALVTDWNEFNQVMVNVKTSTQRKPDLILQESKVPSSPNTDCPENLSSFQQQQQQQQQQQHAHLLKPIIDDNAVIQKEETMICLLNPLNDSLPNANTNVDKTLKEESKLYFSTLLWDDIPVDQQHHVRASVSESTASTSSTTKQNGNASGDNIHNPVKNVYDDKEEEEWVTSSIPASQTPVPSSSFSIGPSSITPSSSSSSSSSEEENIPSRRYSREELYGMNTRQEYDIGNTAASLINKQMKDANKRKYKQQELKSSIIQIRPVRQPPKDHVGGFSPGIPPAIPRTSIVVYHDL